MARSVKELFDLSGRVAIITGGAGMLGMQHAAAISEAGGHAVIADLSEEAVSRSARELTDAYGLEAFGVQVDITENPPLADLFAKDSAARTHASLH